MQSTPFSLSKNSKMGYDHKMNARQYKPYTSYYKTVPRIIYPVKDENPLHDIFRDQDEITNHLDALYEKHQTNLTRGSYHILFAWNLSGHRMTDVWIHDMKNWSDSGPLLECYTFRDLEPCEDAGIASGDSIIALGREEELRRTVLSLDEYVDRSKHMPRFPKNMDPTETFAR